MMKVLSRGVKDKDLYVIKGEDTIYLRVLDEATGKPATKSTGCQNTTQGIIEARKFKQKYYDEKENIVREKVSENIPSFEELLREYIKEKRLGIKTALSYGIVCKIMKVATEEKNPILYEGCDWEAVNKELEKYKIATRNLKITKIRTILLYAENKYETILNKPKLQLEEQTVKSLEYDIQELKEFLAYLEKKYIDYYKIVKLILLTGLSRNEAYSLEWDDVDFEREIIKVKNQRGKRIDILPMLGETKKFLLSLKREGKEVIKSKKKQGTFFCPQYRLYGKIKYNYNFFRKIYISEMIKTGLSLFQVQQLARRRNLDISQKYFQIDDIELLKNAPKEKLFTVYDNNIEKFFLKNDDKS